ncbi:MAG: hypothetical protein AAF763_00295 [Pseudomonadota bacterium]
MIRYVWFAAASCAPVAFFMLIARPVLNAFIVTCPPPEDAAEGAVPSLRWCLGGGFDAGLAAGDAAVYAADISGRYDYGIGVSAMALATLAAALAATACIVRLERPPLAAAVLALAVCAGAWTFWADLAAANAVQGFLVEETLRAAADLNRHAAGDADRLIAITNRLESFGYLGLSVFLAGLGVIAAPPERRSADALRERRRWLGLLLALGAFQFICFVFATRSYLLIAAPYLSEDWRAPAEVMADALGRYWGFLGSAMLAIPGALAFASFAAESRALAAREAPQGDPQARRDWLAAQGLDLPVTQLIKQAAVVLTPFLSGPLLSLANLDWPALLGG